MNQYENMRIELKKIEDKDFIFLYELLRERDPIYNISHKKMPSYDEHEEFIKTKPYANWYIIFLNEKKIGAGYLSFYDEIGISFLPDYDNEVIRKKSLIELVDKNPRKKYFANVNPKNQKYKEFLKEQGFELFLSYDENDNCPQDTFELKRNNSYNDLC